MDVTQPESVERAFAQVKARGALDVLVNNAGIGVFTPFWERDYAEFMQVMSVNAGGTFLCTREALRLMKDQGQGAIINIGSVYGVVSSDPRIYTDCARMNSEVYSASKAAVIQMTKYFAVHAAPLGVRVNCVSPGGVFNHQGDDFVGNYSQRTPMNRMATGQDICGAVIFLATPEAGYVSGKTSLSMEVSPHGRALGCCSGRGHVGAGHSLRIRQTRCSRAGA
jgi:3-oxoacyl-[acyl-carrier protein] reductase